MQGNIVGMNTGRDMCQTQLQALIWQKPCSRVDAVWVLQEETAPAPAQSFCFVLVSIPCPWTECGCGIAAGTASELGTTGPRAGHHWAQSWAMFTPRTGSEELDRRGMYVCACAALLHTHSKCCFPRANKLNLAAEGRWCLRSLHQAEK